jgi:acyl-CoA synthetase (AMP-forming)/AMP-acid ligase II/acyl carrier protein
MLINSGWSGNKNLKVLCGGEAMTADLACKLLERSACVWNLYGPTETTIWSIIHQVTSGEQSPPIGRPIPNTEIYVLDAHLQPVPEGVVGELYIGGAGLARGYLNRPELTAESFLPQPFPREGSSASVYKTGDTVRYRSGGALEYCGRRDDQVKVRGYRIEPNEIITALNQHAAILASTVSLREGADSEKRLVAYVVPRPGAPLREADLREHLGTRLPKYMIPAAFVRMDSLTLNSNDKVDRAALPIPDSHNTLRDEISITASSPIEKRVGETLAALLEVDRVGTDANFFDLGGHSLLGTQFIARLRDSFAVELTVRNLFETPTVAGISATIEQLLLKDQPGTEETLRLART